MDELRLYVWKEWREQRATAALLAALIAAFVAGAVLLLPSDPARDPVVLACVPYACSALALIAIGGELLGGEERRGTLRFLERAPAGLRTAFVAKLALFLGLVPAFAAFGLGVALVASRLRTGSLPSPLLDAFVAKPLPLAALLALWTFAVSTWVGRGALALPLAAMLLAALGWPVALAVGENPWLVPTARQLGLFLVLAAMGALAGAALGFTRGLRFGRGSRSAAWRGLVVGALLLSPGGAWAAHRWHLSRTVDPTAEDFVLLQAWLGADGRRVFLNGSRRCDRHVGPVDVTREHDPWRAFVVELDSGSWRPMPGPRPVWLPVAADRQPRGTFEPTSRVDALFLYDDPDVLERQLLDARTLEPTGLEAVAPLFEGLPDGASVAGWAGLGLRLFRQEANGLQIFGVLDVDRGRPFEARELFPDDADHAVMSLFVRPGRWLHPDARYERWLALDPETGAREELTALAGCRVLNLALLDDGRVLVVRDGALARFDPDRGTFEGISFADGWTGAIASAWNARMTRTPLGRLDPIVLGLDADGWRGLARFDLDTLELVRCTGAVGEHAPRLVATPDRDTLLAVEESRRLVRLRFGSDERELLFPR